MSIEYRLTEGAGLEQRETQEHCIADACPDSGRNIVCHGYALNKCGVDGYTDHNQECLESESKQTAQIVLADLAPFVVYHGCHRDRRQRGNHIDLDHPTIDNDENTDRENPGNNTHQHGLEPHAEQWPDVHFIQAGFQIADNSVYIYFRIGQDGAGRAVYNALGNIEHAHDYIPGICDDQHSAGGFEKPLEKHEGIDIMHIVPVNQHVNQIHAHHKCQDDSGNRNNNVLRK